MTVLSQPFRPATRYRANALASTNIQVITYMYKILKFIQIKSRDPYLTFRCEPFTSAVRSHL